MHDRRKKIIDGKAVKAPWLRALQAYLLAAAAGHFLWESAQLPFYVIWTEGDIQEKSFAVLHCTAGDVLIAIASLAAGLVLAGDPVSPRRRFLFTATVTLFVGLGYTIYNEWRKSNWKTGPMRRRCPRFRRWRPASRPCFIG